MLYLIEPAHALAFVAGLPVLAVWLYAYTRAAPVYARYQQHDDPGLEPLAYAIGPIALLQPPWVPVAATVAAVLLLTARERLHRLIHVVPRDELLTAGEFLVLVGIVLPLVPNVAVTSLTPLTPYGVWLAVVAVCTLSYISYLLQRYLPQRDMALMPAILGGAYSSTATTVVLAKRLREHGSARADISAGIVAATAVMYVRLGIVVAIFDWRIALTLGAGADRALPDRRRVRGLRMASRQSARAVTAASPFRRAIRCRSRLRWSLPCCWWPFRSFPPGRARPSGKAAS